MEQRQTLHETITLWNLLAEAAHQIESDPEEAEKQVRAVLDLAPGQPQALQLLVDGRRAMGDLQGARKILTDMAIQLPGLASIHFELGALLADMEENGAAVVALSRVLELEPRHPQANRILSQVHVRLGDAESAAQGMVQQFGSSLSDLKMLEQVTSLGADQADAAEHVLREYLNISPTDLAAHDMLGRMYLRGNLFESAEQSFTHALEIAPSFYKARVGRISAVQQQLRPADELADIDFLLQEDPENLDFALMKVNALSSSGQSDDALRFCEELKDLHAANARFWLVFGHALRVAGKQDGCIAAYRKALQLQHDLGEAWWGLANLKTFHFSAPDVLQLRSQIRQPESAADNRAFLHFSFGKALEDEQQYAESFAQYAAGNALIRRDNPYDIGEVEDKLEREKQRFSAEFFKAHLGRGNHSKAPIFILGLPRSGSTLVEQILASHSMVEGGGELPALISVVRKLESHTAGGEPFGTAAALFEKEGAAAAGEEYLARCKSYLKESRRHFTDKMPSNLRHLGVICAILPQARIIDIRRHPLACCFSNYKQIFPFRQGPSYDLSDIGKYYRSYVDLLSYFDRIIPGRVHRVIYEDLVRNPEVEIARLLDYCELPFEEACLRFHETQRGIRTVSSEQVRQPLYTDSIEQWRNFDPWLGPLKSALGDVLDSYPAVPKSLR